MILSVVDKGDSDKYNSEWGKHKSSKAVKLRHALTSYPHPQILPGLHHRHLDPLQF